MFLVWLTALPNGSYCVKDVLILTKTPSSRFHNISNWYFALILYDFISFNLYWVSSLPEENESTMKQKHCFFSNSNLNIAPATPLPWFRYWFAAFTITSTSSSVISFFLIKILWSDGSVTSRNVKLLEWIHLLCNHLNNVIPRNLWIDKRLLFLVCKTRLSSILC